MPIFSLFGNHSLSPIHICVSRPSQAAPSTYFVHQRPMTRLTTGSNVRVFFSLVNRSFSVMGRIKRIHSVRDGYTVFRLHHSVEDIDFDFLAVPDDWTRLGFFDRISYRHHQQRGRKDSPTPIPHSHSDSAIPTTTPASGRMRALQHAVSLPFLVPPQVYRNGQME